MDKAKNNDKLLSKNIIWQMLGKFLLQGTAIITAPVFTRLLSQSDYGYVSLFQSWESILSLCIGLQTSGTIATARIKFKPEEFDRYLSSIISISLISFLIFLTIGVCFRPQLAVLLELKENVILLLAIQSFFSCVVSFYVTKLDHLKEAKKSTILSSAASISGSLLALILVLLTDIDRADGKIFGNALPYIVLGAYLLIILYKKGKCFYNKTYWKFCFSFCIPIIGHAIGGLIFTQTDRLMLQRMINNEALAIYSITYNLCQVLSIVYQAFNTAWIPFYYDDRKAGNFDDIHKKSSNYVKIAVVIYLGFLCLAPEVFKVFAPSSYYDGIKIIPIFAIGFFFNYLYFFPVNFEFYSAKVKIIPIMTLASAGINVIINALLIPKYSIAGAAIGTAVGNLASFLFHDIAARYLVKGFEYDRSFYVKPLIITIIASLLYVPLLDLWIVRWLIAIFLCIYQISKFIKNKSIF